VLATDSAPNWAKDVGGALRFIRYDIPNLVPILSPNTRRAGGDELVWMHRTLAEAMAAERMVSHGAGRSEALFQLVRDALKDPSLNHAFALTLLATMARRNENGAVGQILRRCIRSSVPGQRPKLLALRALAAGIDAEGVMRAELLNLLLRTVVTEYQESMRCSEIFASADGLPSPLKILERSELREDVIAAMAERFRSRRSRGATGGVIVALKREAKILDHLAIWSRFPGVVRPDDAPPPRSRSLEPNPIGPRPLTPLRGIAGAAMFEVRDAGGRTSRFEMHPAQFVEQVVSVDRMTQGQLDCIALLHIVVNHLAQTGEAIDTTRGSGDIAGS
jgi:hypothetical protein